MAEEESPRSPLRVIREILCYLIEHPDAKDTIDGILRWWLRKGDVELRKEEVQRAIDELISKRWVVMRETTPSQAVYSVDKQQLPEIRAFLLKTNDRHNNTSAS